MQISVILAHPDKGSFNHAIGAMAVARLKDNGHEVFFHDLYEEGFDCVLPGCEIPSCAALPETIQLHCDEIAASGGIIIVHPNWWGMPPAILKGWLDRVIRPGVAYKFLEGDGGEGVPVGLLQARSALVFNTSNTEAGRERAVFGDPLELIWKKCVFDLCGVKNVRREMFGVVVTSTWEQRADWLGKVGRIVDEYYPEAG